MRLSRFQKSEFIQQADRIERALSLLELPTKIQGGQVGGGRVRYFLSPTTDGYLQRMRQMANRVAEEIGVFNLNISESDGNVVLDLPMEEERGIRLLPLLEEIDPSRKLTSVIGISSKGKPYTIDFLNPKSRNLLILGGAKSGKSEFLRTVLFSVALKNEQTRVNFLAIDVGGNELQVLEALPHGLAEVASERRHGIELLRWLIDEIERREVFRIHYPELFLLIDDVDKVIGEDPQCLQLLERVIVEGNENSVHVVLALVESSQLQDVLGKRENGMVTATALMDEALNSSNQEFPGRFRICLDHDGHEIRVAWMPAIDLQDAVSSIQSGRGRKGVQRKIVRWF